MPRQGYIQVQDSGETHDLLTAEAVRRGLDPEAHGVKTRLIAEAVREIYAPAGRSVLKAQLDMATDMLYRVIGPDGAESLRRGILQWSVKILHPDASC